MTATKPTGAPGLEDADAVQPAAGVLNGAALADALEAVSAWLPLSHLLCCLMTTRPGIGPS